MSLHEPPEAQRDHTATADLRQIGRMLLRRRWLIAGTVVVGIGLATAYSLITRPLYRSEVTLEIERRGPDVLEFTEVIGSDPAGYHDYYQTQYKILQSDRVLHSAVEDADLAHHPSFVDRKPSPIGQVVRAVRTALGAGSTETDPELRAQDFLRRQLRITPVRNSHLVKVGVVDSDPVLARALATSVSGAYQRFMFDSRYRTTGEANAFLARDVALVQDEIDALERTLQSLAQERSSIPAREGDTPIAEQSLSTLNQSYSEALAALSAAEAYHRSVSEAGIEALSEVTTNGLVVHLREQRTRLEREATRLAERFNEDWPTLRQVREQLSETNAQLRREEEAIATRVRATAQREVQAAKATVAALAENRDGQMQAVHDERRDSIEYDSLRSKISTKREVLSDMMARQGQTATSFRSRETGSSNIRVVDEASVPRKPFHPRTGPNILLGALLGVAGGVGLAFLMEQLDSTVRTARDVKQVTQLALLAQIPATARVEWEASQSIDQMPEAGQLDLASFGAPQSGVSEAFRNLRTSLLLSSPDAAPRHLVVTSSSPGEGKSTVSVNLAIVLTKLGRRVLLVDADLRRPRLHQSLSLSREVGLSSYLSGNCEFDELLQETAVPGLFGVSAGPTPPNPSELLGSPRMRAGLDLAVDQYGFDHVILDSPPTLAVADAVVLAAVCHGTILVVRAGQTSTDRMTLAANRLREAHARVVGVVLNGTREGDGYGGYDYYYSSDTDSRRRPREPRRVRRAG